MGHVVEIGSVLDIDGGGDLNASTWTRGKAVRIIGAARLDALLTAAWGGVTSVTATRFRFEVSDDASNWQAVACVDLSTADVLEEMTLAASAGATTYARMSTPNAQGAKYVAVAAKTNGTPAAGDTADATLTVIDGGASDV